MVGGEWFLARKWIALRGVTHTRGEGQGQGREERIRLAVRRSARGHDEKSVTPTRFLVNFDRRQPGVVVVGVGLLQIRQDLPERATRLVAWKGVRVPKKTSQSGSELFIVDNSDTDWKVLRYLHDWCQISKQFDIASGYFELGALLGLKAEWQKVDKIRILMGEEVSLRTKEAFAHGLHRMHHKLDQSLESEKLQNDFLDGVPAIVDGIKSGKIECRVYRKEKFHAKAYITHARLEVVGAAALVGSSNFTFPGLTKNIELNVQITGRPVHVLQEWYEEHWNNAEDVTPEVLRVIERHVREFTPFEVYAKSLHELLGQQEHSDKDWLENHSIIWPILDQYQKDGFRKLLKIADSFGGAFLCDGVGLGKTFVGLMLIEYLIEKKRKRVALFVPKVGREAVWERALETRGLGHLADGVFCNLVIFNHTDLGRAARWPLSWSE